MAERDLNRPSMQYESDLPEGAAEQLAIGAATRVIYRRPSEDAVERAAILRIDLPEGTQIFDPAMPPADEAAIRASLARIFTKEEQ